jgi:hypothetical protein
MDLCCAKIRTTANLNQALKNLSARKTLDEGGYGALEGGEGSYRDILKTKGGRVARTGKARRKRPRTPPRGSSANTKRACKPSRTTSSSSARSRNFTRRKNSSTGAELYDRIKNSEMGNDPSLDTAIANTIVRGSTIRLRN